MPQKKLSKTDFTALYMDTINTIDVFKHDAKLCTDIADVCREAIQKGKNEHDIVILKFAASCRDLFCDKQMQVPPRKYMTAVQIFLTEYGDYLDDAKVKFSPKAADVYSEACEKALKP